MVAFHFITLLSGYSCCFHQSIIITNTNIYPFHFYQGLERVHNLRLRLCTNLGCKSWLHGESKASKIGYWLLHCSVKNRLNRMIYYTVG